MILFIVGSIVAFCQITVVCFFIWQVAGAMLEKMVGGLSFLEPVEKLIITIPAQWLMFELAGNVMIRGFMS